MAASRIGLRRPRRLWRALGLVGATLGLGVVFTGSVAVAVALHLDLAPTRRIVRDGANALLGSLFRGAIVVESVDRVGLGGVDVGSARVEDANGEAVIRARGVHAEANVIAIAAAAIGLGPELRITIDRARVDEAEVLVEPAWDGKLGIAEAFAPRSTPPPAPPTKPANARAVRVLLPAIEVGHAHARGRLAPPRSLDADVQRLAASIRIEPEGFTLDVARTGLVDRAFLPATTVGTADYHLRVLPAHDAGAPPTVRMWTEVVAEIGSLQTQARALLEDGWLTGTIEVPTATPADVASFVPGLRVAEPLSLHGEIDGPIPTFDVALTALLRPSFGAPREVRAEGRLAVAGPLRAEADFTLRDVDPSAIDLRLPVGRFSGEGHAVAELGAEPRLSVDARTDPGILADVLVPAATVHLDLARSGLVASAWLDEPGAPIDAVVSLGEGRPLAFAADASIPSLAAAPRLRRAAEGSATVHVDGTLSGTTLEARVSGVAAAMRAGGASLDSARVRGRLRGPVDALVMEAEVEGHGLSAGATAFETATVRASGPLLAPRVEASLADAKGGGVQAKGRLDAKATALDGVEVAISRGGDRLEGKVARISAAHGRVAVEGASLAGEKVGAVQGSLGVEGGDVVGHLSGRSVDLAHVAHLVGASWPVRGVADLDVAIARAPGGGHEGHVQIEIEDASLYRVPGLSAHVTAELHGDRVKADGLVRLLGTDADGEPAADARCAGEIASLRLTGGDGALRGPLLAPATWRGLTGTATVAADRVALACVREKIPLLALATTALRGEIAARATIERPEKQRFPSLRDVAVRTAGLEIGGPPRGALDRKASWALSCQAEDEDEDAPRPAKTSSCTPLDVAITGGLDGASGRAHATILLRGSPMDLASATLDVGLDLPTLADAPARRAASLRASPFSLNAKLEPRDARDYAALPPLVQRHLPKYAGKLALDVYADGTPSAPFVIAKARGEGLAIADAFDAPAPSPLALPLDVAAIATYDASHGTLDATVKQRGHAVARLNAELDAELAAVLGGAPRVTGGLLLELGAAKPGADDAKEGQVALDTTRDGLSLGQLGLLAERDVAGHVHGTFRAQGLGAKPVIETDLETKDLVLGAGEPPLVGRVRSRVVDRLAAASVQFAPVEAAAGSFTVAAQADVSWWRDLVPVPDLEGRGSVTLISSAFGVGALRPIVSPWIANLGGALEGTATAQWDRLEQRDAASITGRLTVRDAVVNVPQLGRELRADEVRISGTDGRHVEIDVPRPPVDPKATPPRTAADVAKAVTAHATVDLGGLSLRGGHASVDLPADVPITFEGVPLGEARGRVDVDLRSGDRELGFDVKIPSLHVELPQAPRLGVQALDDDPDITISSAPHAKTERARTTTTARPLVVTVSADEIHVEGEAPGGGKGLDLVLKTRKDPTATADGRASSTPTFRFEDKLVVSGDIEAVRGKVDVYGKLFELDEGLVRLRPEDPSNPYVNLVAHWDAPDGSRITVGWNGPLLPITDDKLVLRSDPPRTGGRQAILAALLFGVSPSDATAPATTPTDASQGTDAGSKAVGVGGSLATAELSALLSGTLLRGLSARFGTTAEGSLATTVEYQVGQKVIAAATFENAGAAASGATGSTTSGATTSTTPATQTAATRANRTEISIDWRFAQQWSLRATVGVAADQPNSGLDLLWQYRY